MKKFDQGSVIRIVYLSLKRRINPELLQEERSFWVHYFGIASRISRQTINSEIAIHLKQLQSDEPLVVKILKDRFFLDFTILKTSIDNNLSRDQVNRRQSRGIQHIAKLLVSQIERENQFRLVNQTYQMLPIQTNQVVGNDAQLEKLYSYLVSSDDHWIITVSGIGGIGKTTLASVSLQRIIKEAIFHQIIWISYEVIEAKQENDLVVVLVNKIAAILEILPDKVYPILKTIPYLIAIDGIDVDLNLKDFINELNRFIRPSKFLLTSRARPLNISKTTHLEITQLNGVDTLALIEDYAKAIGVEELLPELQNMNKKIYQIIGGNPLALRIFVGLLEVFSADVLLADFEQAEIIDINELYQEIYMKSWLSLSVEGQKLLLAFELANTGVGIDLDNLGIITKLPPKELLKGIRQLFVRSLIGKRGTVSDVRYDIHSLTRSFIRTKL